MTDDSPIEGLQQVLDEIESLRQDAECLNHRSSSVCAMREELVSGAYEFMKDRKEAYSFLLRAAEHYVMAGELENALDSYWNALGLAPNCFRCCKPIQESIKKIRKNIYFQ